MYFKFFDKSNHEIFKTNEVDDIENIKRAETFIFDVAEICRKELLAYLYVGDERICGAWFGWCNRIRFDDGGYLVPAFPQYVTEEVLYIATKWRVGEDEVVTKTYKSLTDFINAVWDYYEQANYDLLH